MSGPRYQGDSQKHARRRLYFMYDCNRRLFWAAVGAFSCLAVAHGVLNYGPRSGGTSCVLSRAELLSPDVRVAETASMFVEQDGGACVYRAPLAKVPLLLCAFLSSPLWCDL